MDLMKPAKELLQKLRGDAYLFGIHITGEVGGIAAGYGTRALLVANTGHLAGYVDTVAESLRKAGVQILTGGPVKGARPNTPREDVYRLEGFILHHAPDVIVAVGGGSTIDCVKAAATLAACGRISADIEDYFGTGLVTETLSKAGTSLVPLVAVETSASSSAHLTKYSNITDPQVGQKKLIVDEAIVPPKAVFDYAVTATQPRSLTADGVMDGISHCIETYFGASKENMDILGDLAEANLRLSVRYAPEAMKNPADLTAREALGMATDLGGCAIMIGGTNGGHLTSFSLVDVTSHGRACGIMNPYYMAFFAPAIEPQVRRIGSVLRSGGFMEKDPEALNGTGLGIAVARGMTDFMKSLDMPVTLKELPEFTEQHIGRALEAAKNPQLKMKLQNMPIPLSAENVDTYMGPVLQAAASGDFSLIRPYS